MKSLLIIASILCLAMSFNMVSNTEKLINETPRLLASVPNGQKLLIGDLNDPLKNYLYIANLKGTPFEMGEAFGKLFK
jgi:hypothetical protein